MGYKWKQGLEFESLSFDIWFKKIEMENGNNFSYSLTVLHQAKR